jgi:tRNA pseudouridine13 synthase
MIYPYLTTSIPGTGGIFKESAGDFEVTEIPLYPPCGSGEHTYVLVEKQGLATLEMIRRLARHLNVPDREIGYAGMKDARGITRQTISMTKVPPETIVGLELPGIRVLGATRHNNKLRLGHLSGNGFRIRLRNVHAEALERAEAILGILGERGVPNYFGEQRYGSQGNSATVGRELLKGDFEAAVRALIGNPEAVRDERWQSAIVAFQEGRFSESLELFPGHCRTEREVIRTIARKPDAWEKGIKSIHPRLISLYLSACQSKLFDAVLAARMPEIDKLEAGDIAFKHLNGACFLVEDAADAALRAQTFEISPTGPMCGAKMLLPGGAVAGQEAAVLADSGLSLEDFTRPGKYQLSGERRPLRVQIKECSAAMEGDDLVLEFTLPKGSYATSVLREIMK